MTSDQETFVLQRAGGGPPVLLTVPEPPLHDREELNLYEFEGLLRRLVFYLRYGETNYPPS